MHKQRLNSGDNFIQIMQSNARNDSNTSDNRLNAETEGKMTIQAQIVSSAHAIESLSDIAAYVVLEKGIYSKIWKYSKAVNQQSIFFRVERNNIFGGFN